MKYRLNIAADAIVKPVCVVQVALKVTCVSSFPDVPHLQLSYSLQGQQVAQNLMLPIVVAKFCTPPDNPVPKDVFFSRWRAIAGQPPLYACCSSF